MRNLKWVRWSSSLMRKWQHSRRLRRLVSSTTNGRNNLELLRHNLTILISSVKRSLIVIWCGTLLKNGANSRPSTSRPFLSILMIIVDRGLSVSISSWPRYLQRLQMSMHKLLIFHWSAITVPFADKTRQLLKMKESFVASFANFPRPADMSFSKYLRPLI